MTTRSYTSRTEFAQYSFNPLVVIAVPFVLILLQVLLPLRMPRLLILDLPLIAVIFFSVSWRSPIFGALFGCVIGLAQDALTGQYLGINGIAETLVGYAASSIGLQVDVENVATRLLMSFGFTLLQSGVIFGIERYLLRVPVDRLRWVHELIRAGVNTAIAIPLFVFLDRFKERE